MRGSKVICQRDVCWDKTEVGRYVKSGYAYLIKKPLCCSGLDSSKQTLLDVERHNPAPIHFFFSLQDYFEHRH